MGRSIALTLANDGADVVLNYGTNRTWFTESDADQDAMNDYLAFLNEQNGVVGGSFTITAGAAVTLTGAGFVAYRINGQVYYVDLDTTIELEDSGDVAADDWGAWRIVIDAAGVVTTQDTGAQMDWTEEEFAIMNLSNVAPTANTATIGYFTIDSDTGFNIGTDNVNGETAANVYHVRGPQALVTGLNAALGSAIVADVGAATWSSGTINVNINGVKKTEIAAVVNQAMDDADTITTLKAGGWLLVVDLAGTGVYALAADGNAEDVSAMAYATTAAVDTAIDSLCDQLPEVLCPIGKIVVDNGSGGTFTAGTTNWDATDITTVATDITLGVFDRTASGFAAQQINPPGVPASITAPIGGDISRSALTDPDA